MFTLVILDTAWNMLQFNVQANRFLWVLGKHSE